MLIIAFSDTDLMLKFCSPYCGSQVKQLMNKKNNSNQNQTKQNLKEIQNDTKKLLTDAVCKIKYKSLPSKQKNNPPWTQTTAVYLREDVDY